MAVAMEVAWRGVELGSSPVVLEMSKKRAWGADTEKLMQFMMGQFGSSSSSGVKQVEVTLDLLGTAAGSSPVRGSELDCNSSAEFLELDPDQPLPADWEKCLDLKTGELYFVNKSTGVRTSEDPRKVQQRVVAVMTRAVDSVPTASPLAHEFLGSKRSETLREESLRTSTSSGSSGGTSPRNTNIPGHQLLSFSTGKQLWNLQLDDRRTVSLNRTGSPKAQAPPFLSFSDEEESNLELDLNLAAGGNSPRLQQHNQQQSVCTMEMVEKALKRTEKALGKREMPTTSFGPKQSGSSSFSSLPSARGESWSHSSPSTSSSSSTSSRSGHQGASHHDDSQRLRPSAPGVSEAESRKIETTVTGALVMGACTRCLMYVMLNKSDPKCPRCENEVPLDFSSPPSGKRQRVETFKIQMS
ncbi:uncharacterized protein [Physcomitrium patens]|uniref:WW domain-containing protein n=1 Tax=Physcomitrium patens TaxID=3218 RepID=A0A2K1IAS0_PHYPA|nr:transcriptional coactivator YAP1-like [Physcomitrium patens]PNR26370.1 hypothetical protein PHYPA_030945 [Physcomitrium patens]|eukprot:XP_024367873.1 transcriptional coactivator YAP1-like [Physcomitrella patens]